MNQWNLTNKRPPVSWTGTKRPVKGPSEQTFDHGEEHIIVVVGSNLTVLSHDKTTGISYGYESTEQDLTGWKNVKQPNVQGVIRHTPFQVFQAFYGLTRKTSRITVTSTGGEWYWQKTGIIARMGTAHSFYRADGTELARTKGSRQLEINSAATQPEFELMALMYASGVTEHCAKPGLSSLLWF